MPDADAKINSLRLSAALSSVDGGVAYDPSKPEGELHAAALVAPIMNSVDQLDLLLAALERDGLQAGEADRIPRAFGPVVMKSDFIPSHSDWDLPPLGSPEADAFMDEALSAQHGLADMPLDSKAIDRYILGSLANKPEPICIESAKRLDNILRRAQRHLALLVKKTQRPGFLSRVYISVFSPEFKPEPLRFSTKTFENHIVIEAKRGGHIISITQSVASGSVFFVQVEIDGEVALKDRLSLSDPLNTSRQFSELFAGQAEIGAAVLREWRDANATMAMESWSEPPSLT